MEMKNNYIKIRKQRKTLLWVIAILVYFSISLPISAQNAEELKAEISHGIELFKAGNYAEAAPVLDSIIPIIRDTVGDMDTVILTKLLNITGQSYHHCGQYDKAESFYQEMLTIDKKIFGQNHLTYGRDLYNLASLYKDMGRYEQAVSFMREAIKIDKNINGINNYNYSYRINNLALLYHQMRQYEDAEKLMIESMKINRTILGEDHPTYIQSIRNLAILYEYMQKYEESEKLFLELIECNKKAFGDHYPKYGTDINSLAHLYINTARYDDAEILLIEAVELGKEQLGENSPEYGIVLQNLGVVYKGMGRYNEALTLMNKALQIDKNAFGENNPEYVTDLSNLATLYDDMGMPEKAEQLLLQAIKITKDIYGKNSIEYSIKINNLGSVYYNLGRFEEAELLMTEALQIDKDILGTSHTSYGRNLNNLTTLYKEIGQYNKAESLIIESIQINKNVFGEFHPSYATSLNNLVSLYYEMGRYREAEILMKEVIQIDSITLGITHPEYAKHINNLAHLYRAMCKYGQVDQLLTEAIEIYKTTLGVKHPNYGLVLNSLGSFYSKIGKYEQAEPLLIESMEIDKYNFGENNLNFGKRLTSLSILYTKMGRYGLAETYLIKALQIIKNSLGDDHYDYAIALNNLAQLYERVGLSENAEEMMIKAIDIVRETHGKQHPRYASMINNLAPLYVNAGDYKKAKSLMLESKRVIKETLGINHLSYAGCLSNLANLHVKTGDYMQAEQLMIDAMSIIEENLGKTSYKYLNEGHDLSLLYSRMGKIDQADSLMTSSFGLMKKHLKQNSGFLSENELEQFFATSFYKNDIYQSIIFQKCDSNRTLELFALDIELFRKGILLESVLKTRKSILGSNDTTLNLYYQEMISLRKQSDKLYNLRLKERYLDPDSLMEKANELEKVISLQSKEYRQSVAEQDITWKQVKDSLEPGEASIEFSSFNFYDKGWTDSTLYCALVLQKDFEYPKMVYLFEEKQLNKLLSSTSGNTEDIEKTYSIHHEESKANKIYDLIWGPLEPHLDGVEKVSISASGELNKLAFHALPDSSGKLLSSKYDLVQLSSTREVALSKEDNSIETFALFGGVDYSLDTTEMFAMAKKQHATDIPRAIYRGDTTARGLTLSYLPGTMEEANEIGKDCRASGKEVEVYSGKLATEENFRLLGESKSPNVIHIATHGFYFPEEKTKDREERMRFMQTEQENQFIYSPDPLIRSGLALAGANHAWTGEKLPQGVEDGILTARDVSRMNLMNTELVVLSACQTGLGDVKGSEGVYGLQRAFKMAGVRYLLMSLWKVPDESTKEFMVTFYKQLLSGESIRGSYQFTQQVMSAKYPDDPFKWAAFVLVE